MAKKLEIVKETAAAASSARTAKAKTPRVKTAQHSKTAPVEPAANEVVTEAVTQSLPENAGPQSTYSEHPHDVIARIAYSLWESRDGQSGTALEDWVRAEQEYRRRTATDELAYRR